MYKINKKKEYVNKCIILKKRWSVKNGKVIQLVIVMVLVDGNIGKIIIKYFLIFIIIYRVIFIHLIIIVE
jgi:hypothetical protein